MGSTGLPSTPDIQALGAGLEVLQLREKLIANNLANADTPGYRKQDVAFGPAFRAALAGSDPSAGSLVRSPAVYGTDGNGVDMDAQMAELAKTGLHYQATSQMLALALARVRTAITGRES